MAKSSGKSMKINFGGVDKEIRKGGSKSAHVPEGDYLLKIVEAEIRKNKSGDGKHISWRFTIVAPPKYKGKTVYDITALKPDALWNLRNLIHAATGKNVAGKAVNFNPETLYGKVIASTLEDNEYTKDDGTTKISSRPADYRPKEELNLAGEEDDDEEDDDEEEVEETDDGEEDDDDLEDVDVEDI